MSFTSTINSIDPESVGLHELTKQELLQLQDVLINMLQEIAEVCEKYDISWALTAGSALGCVRNDGFIPWDDDIDINMTRKSFEKFKEVFQKELSEKYDLKEPGDKNYLLHFPKIQKKQTTSTTIQSINGEKDGIAIDIFILENTYKNKFMRTLHGIECTIYLFIDSVLRVDKCKDHFLQYTPKGSKARREVRMRLFFSFFFKFRSLEDWLLLSDKCFSKVSDDSSEFVVIPSGSKHYFGEIYPREKMCKVRKHKFADKKFFLMENADYYLRKRYGADYMSPPAESYKRRNHSYIEFDLNK